jgi:hypothetical protein
VDNPSKGEQYMSLKEIITVVGPIAGIATVAVGAVGASTYAYIHTRRSKNTPSPEISTSEQESEANKALKLKPKNAADYGRRGASYY